MADDTKELLELAAKACGFIVGTCCPERGVLMLIDGVETLWNPLTPGDGAVMEAKLGLDVIWREEFVRVDSDGRGVQQREYYHVHNNDKQLARMWASLRCAAEIGRAMK